MPRQSKKDEYAYILSWINEAIEARASQNEFVERAIKAFQGKPYRNFYKQTALAYAKQVTLEDPVKGSILQQQANDMPTKGSMVVHNAIETIVSSTMGGIGRFEFAPYDPDQDLSDDTADRLASASKHFYHTEKIDSLMPQAIRHAALAGSAWFHLKQKTGESKKQVTLLETSQMLTDPKRFKTNKERYIGFQQRESFDALKSRIKSTKTGAVLNTLNEAEVYLGEIKNQINRINGVGEMNDNIANAHLSADIDLFYSVIAQQTEDLQKGNSEYTWNGDDVEVSYIYDLLSKKDFMVINRRYVVQGQETKLSRVIKYKSFKYDKNNEPKEVDKECKVELDHPFVEIPFMKTHWDKFTISPLFYVLDDFDSLCSMESVLYHNLSIMAPITFIAQSSDGELVSRAMGVSGEIVDGLPQTFGVLGKAHDLTPVSMAIQKYEDRIKRVLKATDPMELQAMIGDRATAKEVVGAMGQVAQGLNPFIANLESAIAEVGQKFLKLEVIYSGKDSISFTHNGEYAELAPEEVAGTWDVVAKLASSVKLEQESNSRKAIELVQYLNGADFIDKREFIGTMIPIVLTSLVNREQAMKMIGKDYKPMEEEIITRIRARAEEDAKKHPIDKLDLSEFSEDELMELANSMSQMGTQDYGDGTVPIGPDGLPVNQADMEQQIANDPALQAEGGVQPVPGEPAPAAPVVTGVQEQTTGMPASEEAGIISNDPNGGGYAA